LTLTNCARAGNRAPGFLLGVFLPGNLATQNINGEAVHSTLHTNKYVAAVNEALKKATTREEAIGILRASAAHCRREDIREQEYL
jgi:hypothetical protein